MNTEKRPYGKKSLKYGIILSAVYLIFSLYCSAQSKIIFSKFQEVPISTIRPEGWLRNWLISQKNGLTGHMEVAGTPFSDKGWGKPIINSTTPAAWWPYEQTGYWLEGFIRCAQLLDDSALIKKYKSILQYEFQNHLGPDGFIGPSFLKKEGDGNYWPYSIFNRSLILEYIYGKDPSLLAAIKRNILLPDYTKSPHDMNIREESNIESLMNLYHITGDAALFKKATETFQAYLNDTLVKAYVKGRPVYAHGVTYNVTAALGAIMYTYTGNKEFLNYSVEAYDIIDKYYTMADGVNVSSEHLRTPVNSLSSHETCDISDMTWSLGYLLMATGDARYADKIEKAIFNAAPGCVTTNFKALQYFSCPNQFLATANSNHNDYFRGAQVMAYSPEPASNVACCAGNVNRIMPGYASRLWMRTNDNGVAAVLYAPSEFSFQVEKKNQVVRIIEKTNYPFSDEIEFEVITEKPVTFPFIFRIPGWSKDAEVHHNGKKLENITSGTFYTLKNNFKNHDKIKLVLPAKPKYMKWADGGISLERGPLVFSLKIREDRHTRFISTLNFRSDSEFPAYDMYPASDWNYALAIDTMHLEESVKFVRTENDMQNPWQTAPVKMIVTARKVPDWKLSVDDGGGNPRELILTPPLPSNESLEKAKDNQTEDIELVPYGCAKLRVTIFPVIK